MARGFFWVALWFCCNQVHATEISCQSLVIKAAQNFRPESFPDLQTAQKKNWLSVLNVLFAGLNHLSHLEGQTDAKLTTLSELEVQRRYDGFNSSLKSLLQEGETISEAWLVKKHLEIRKIHNIFAQTSENHQKGSPVPFTPNQLKEFESLWNRVDRLIFKSSLPAFYRDSLSNIPRNPVFHDQSSIKNIEKLVSDWEESYQE